MNIPPEVARAVMADMAAYFAETDGIKRDGIAATTLHRLRDYQKPRAKKLRLSDIKDLYMRMRDD